jgi:tRNA threonylcarbamoyladenosine biosynthesis protein TsaE
MIGLDVREADAGDAEQIRAIIHGSFAARPVLDPPSTALDETTASLARSLARHGGLLCNVDGVPAGTMLFEPRDDRFWLRRVCVLPRLQSRGVATALVGVAEEVAAARGHDDVQLSARSELPATVTFWRRRGYAEIAREGCQLTLAKALPVELEVPTSDDMAALGRRLAGVVRRGDLLILTGDLGAGKTTLTRGLGAGLGVRGAVTSPTFVISRFHPSLDAGPGLLHVDAYRLGDGAELDDLDLDAQVDDAVTVVEWGDGMAEPLTPSRLRLQLIRRRGDGPAGDQAVERIGEQARVVQVTPSGGRWVGARLRSTLLGRR